MEWQRFDTACGAPLWFYPMPNIRNMAVGVFVNVGSRDEEWPEEAGMAHALEHMFFQGNEGDLKTQKDIATLVEDVGGIHNAYTDDEYTFFYLQISSQEVERAVKVLGESLLLPRFPEEVVETQMNIVLHELRGRQDQPSMYLFESWVKKRLAGHPLSKLTIGLEESIKNFKRPDFLSFARRFYHHLNFTFVAVGNGSADSLVDLFNKYFVVGNDNKTKNSRVSAVVPPAPEEKLVLTKDTEQVHLVSGAILGKLEEREILALKIYVRMLAGGMSSPLFQELREKKGYCYGVWSNFDERSDAGVFTLGLETSPETFEPALDLAFQIIERERNNAELLERAKKNIIGSLDLIDSSGHILHSVAPRIALYGEPQSFEEIIRKYNSVSIGEVAKVVEKYLSREKFYTGILLPK